MSISAFQKIHTLGKTEVENVLVGEVEITEKLDGSQFAFGVINGELICRSRGQLLDLANPGSLFRPAVEHVISIRDRIEPGNIYYGETLNIPRHNKLAYSRVPKNHIALYYGYNSIGGELLSLEYHANLLDVDSVPVYHNDKADLALIENLLDKESYLGGAKIEGVVIKNYKQNQFAKLVCPEFKEVSKMRTRPRIHNDSELNAFKECFRTEARWDKAIQRLREQELLTGTSKDIGLLCKEVQQDLEVEERKSIEAWLWKHYGKEVIKHSVKGLGAWYQSKI